MANVSCASSETPDWRVTGLMEVRAHVLLWQPGRVEEVHEKQRWVLAREQRVEWQKGAV